MFRKLILLKKSVRKFLLFSSFYTSAKQVLEMLHTFPKDALIFGQRDIFSPLFIILLEPVGKDTWINSLYTIIYSLNHPTQKSKNSWPEWAEPGILRNVLCICRYTSSEKHTAEADTHTHFLPSLFLLWAPWLHEKKTTTTKNCWWSLSAESPAEGILSPPSSRRVGKGAWLDYPWVICLGGSFIHLVLLDLRKRKAGRLP